MTTARETVEEIQSLLKSDMKDDSDTVIEVWGHYCDAWDKVNERLQRCEEYLKKDMLDETVRLALAEPPFLEEFNTLNFLEIHEWEQVLAANDLVPPLMRPSESVERLRSAILEPLLREYRKAVRHDDVRDRISILRRIRQIDPANRSWKEDLKGVEHRRHEQIQQEANEAFEQGNENRLRNLLEELESPGWLSAPQGDLLNSVKIYANRFRSARLAGELESLARELNAVYGGFNFDAARGPVERWREITQAEGFNPPGRVLEQVQDILAWYEQIEKEKHEEASYQGAIKALTAALDARLSRATLEERWNAVERFGREAPEMLARQYERRKELLDLDASRKLRMKIILTSLGVVITIAAIILLAHSSFHRRVLKTWVKNIDNAIKDERFAEGHKLLAELGKDNPEIFRAPEIRALKAKLESKEEAEKERHRNFKETLELAKQTDFSNPAVEQRIDAAAKLAVSPSEQRDVEKLRNDYATHLYKQQKMRDKLFIKTLEGVRGKLRKLRNISAETEGDLYRRDLDNIKSDIDELKGRKDVSKAVHDQAGILEKRVEALEERYAEAQERRIALMEILDAVGEESFFTKLEEYRKKHPRSERAKNFLSILEHRSAFLAVADWAVITRNPEKLLRDHAYTKAILKNKPREGNTRFNNELAMYRKHSKTFPGSVYAGDIPGYTTYWKHFKSACTGNRAKGLLELLDSRSIKDTLVFETKDGERYYCTSFTPRQNPDTYTAVVLYAGNVMVGRVFKKEELKALATRSPQALLADDLRKALASYPDEDWDIFFLKQARKCMEWKDLDPVLKIIIATELLELAKDNLIYQREELDTAIKSLREVDTGVSWLDPDNKKAEEARKQAIKVMATLPNINELIEDVRAANLILLKGMGRPLRFAGIMLTEKWKWAVKYPRGLADGAREFWVLETDESGRGKGFVVAARSESGSIVVNNAAIHLFIEGLPVFVPVDNETTEEFMQKSKISSEMLKRSATKPDCWPKEEP